VEKAEELEIRWLLAGKSSEKSGVIIDRRRTALRRHRPIAPETTIYLTLRKARRVLRKSGARALIERGKNEVLGAASAYWARNTKPVFPDLGSLLDFTISAHRGFIRPIQVRSEILSLLELVRELKPRTVLELGTARGGTLFLWSRIASEEAHLLSIDLPGGGFGDGYVLWRVPVYRSFAVERQRIDLLRGDSHSESMRARARELLGGKQVDFLFIDAGHTYDDVKQDFQMYSSLVAPGGLIAFHDVAVHPQSSGSGVHRFWSEIKSEYESGEFIQDLSQGWAGIGYLRWSGCAARSA
jgi:predicted O-methyltransferase YrrM